LYFLKVLAYFWIIMLYIKYLFRRPAMVADLVQEKDPWPRGKRQRTFKQTAMNIESLLETGPETSMFSSPALPPLFDQNGRRIPPRGVSVMAPNSDFYLEWPGGRNYGQRLNRFSGVGLGSGISAYAFGYRIAQLVEMLSRDERARGILSGIFLPIVIMQIRVGDYGQTAEQFVAAASRAYSQEFTGRIFTNYRQGDLKENVTVVPESRHERLIAKIEYAPVVALYFSGVLQGFSVGAQRAQMSGLPQGFLLGGGIDSAVAMVMYPDILGHSKSPFGLCSAVRWGDEQGDEEFSLAFKIEDDRAELVFIQGMHRTDPDWSGGLLYIGE
jgi:hypothetical protein